MKEKIRKLLGDKLFFSFTRPLAYLRDLRDLYTNFRKDRILYKSHSNVFKCENLNKQEAKIILYYHSIEKGFLFKNPKPRFAKTKIIQLHRYLKSNMVIQNAHLSQIRTGYAVVCKYYEFHKERNIKTDDYFSEDQYLKYKRILDSSYSSTFEGIVVASKKEFYSKVDAGFVEFSSSRRSVRDFTGAIISDGRIEKAISLCLNSPSVCNRQSAKVYLLQSKGKIDEILKIQAGFKGYSDNVNQLLILTVDRNYFYTVGERNQMYIDGGIFLMNLLYALHFYKIANCPANWGKTIKDDKLAHKVINLKDSEKIICLIPIGEGIDEIRVCLSERRNLNEIFSTIE